MYHITALNHLFLFRNNLLFSKNNVNPFALVPNMNELSPKHAQMVLQQ